MTLGYNAANTRYSRVGMTTRLGLYGYSMLARTFDRASDILCIVWSDHGGRDYGNVEVIWLDPCDLVQWGRRVCDTAPSAIADGA
jgi:hypothetical protein